jgi:hypothetical protein
MNDDNVLSTIPSEFLGSQRNGLPDAVTCEEATHRVIVRLPDGARYEVTYLRLRTKKGRSSHWFWAPVSARLIVEPSSRSTVAHGRT